MLTLYKKHTTRKGTCWRVWYETSEGDMEQAEVVKRAGVTPSTLLHRIREFGISDPKVMGGRKKVDKNGKPLPGSKRANWEGLSSKDRSYNLKRIAKYTMSDYLNTGK